MVLTFGRGERALVLGAHFDAAKLPDGKIGPGMVDNAAGVVVLIRLAEAIRDYSFDHRIDFVFFDLEETGQLGSERYVDSMGADRIAAMINVDIVGYGDTVIFGPSSGNGQVQLSQAVRSVCAGLAIDCFSSPLLPVGDFRSFDAAGVPNVSIATLPSAEAHQAWLMFNRPDESGLRDGFVPQVGRVIHTRDDTADRLDPVTMTMAYNVIGSLLAELDRSNM
jgi:Zn-dependent M28 family amino/carboxypeptidase